MRLDVICPAAPWENTTTDADRAWDLCFSLSEEFGYAEVRQDGIVIGDYGVNEVEDFHALIIGGLVVLWGFGGQFRKWHKVGCGGSVGLYTKVTSEGGAGSP